MFAEFREFLQAIPEPYLWIAAGFISETLLQMIRTNWNPPEWDYGKLKTLGAAALVSVCVASVSFTGEGTGAFLAHWLTVYVAAIGYHELKDKTRGPVTDLVTGLIS